MVSVLALSRASLLRIQRYLNCIDMPAIIQDIRLMHSTAEDRRNKRDSRAFCHVLEKSIYIRCALALENISEASRTGVLLHEVAHIASDSFSGASPEEITDLWIVANIPEAGYTYHDESYRMPKSRRFRTAKGLQRVRRAFLTILGD